MSCVFGNFELDEQTYQLYQSGEVVAIEPQAFKLLAYLIAHRDRAVSREELFDKLWPGQVVGDAALTYCVAKARKAVQDTGAQQQIIKTVHGRGYRFVAPIVVTPPISDSRLLVSGPNFEEQETRTQKLETFSREFLAAALEQQMQLAFWSSRQNRQLLMVCCLFVAGWLVAVGSLALRSPILLQPTAPITLASTPDLAQAELRICHWWVVSAKNQAALEALLKGWEYYDRSTPEAMVQARWMLERALELDPAYAAAYASLGWIAWRDWLSWSQNPNSLEQASLYLQKAATLDSSCPRTATLLAEVMATQRRQAQVMTEVQRISALNPN